MSIKFAILGLLSWKPSTGYEMKKTFEESSSMYWSGNNNQIYKTLLQLRDEGLVTSETEHQDGLPSKKIYTITEEGVSELKNWILSSSEAPEFKKPFLIQLAWSELLSDKELLGLLQGYENEIRIQMLMQQEKMKRGMAAPARSQRETFLWEMIDENILSSYKNELDWVQSLINRLFKNEVNAEENKMNYKVNESGGRKYIELISSTAPIGSEQDALDVVALCGEHDVDLVLLHAEAVSDEFFKLKSGLAGKVLQKFANYRIRAAAVVPDEKITSGAFREMVNEANRGNQLRIFSDREQAEKWLVK